jgi:hypothetical protein
MDHAENCMLNTAWYKVLGSSSKGHEAANSFIQLHVIQEANASSETIN